MGLNRKLHVKIRAAGHGEDEMAMVEPGKCSTERKLRSGWRQFSLLENRYLSSEKGRHRKRTKNTQKWKVILEDHEDWSVGGKGSTTRGEPQSV